MSTTTPALLHHGQGPWTKESIDFLRAEMAIPDFTPATPEEAAQGIQGHYRYAPALFAQAKGAWAQDHGVYPIPHCEKQPGVLDPFYGYVVGRLTAADIGIPDMAEGSLPEDIRAVIDSE